MNQTPMDTPSHWRIIATCMNRDFLRKADSLIFIKMNGLCDDGNRERTISAARKNLPPELSGPGQFPADWQVFSFFLKKSLEISIKNAIIGIEGVSRKRKFSDYGT